MIEHEHCPVVRSVVPEINLNWANTTDKEKKMPFWNLSTLELAEFRPGIMSKAEIGENLVMALMQIGPGKEDTGHQHPFDQCGVVLEGHIEMFVGQERRTLGANQGYFIPSGVRHGWKTLDIPAKILDVSVKQS
ncbi:MAG: cupin domain-containing protein [Desulfobacteraceae bacterium]|nr:MAG: cupin domain-containing protein [Desulfobacteraceae bacterium]